MKNKQLFSRIDIKNFIYIYIYIYIYRFKFLEQFLKITLNYF